MSGQEVNYLGFANLPNQMHRKYIKKGFEFTIMVVGESGLGKSTLVQSLFPSVTVKENKPLPVHQKLQETTKIEAKTTDIEERGVRLKLTVVDTPGFGVSLDATNDVKPIITYIDDQYEKYLNHETGLNRRQISDTRINCLFYFISPEAYHLRPLDIYALKALHHKVNIVPMIAKSDTLSKGDLTKLKKRILDDIKSNQIQIYSVPDCDPEEDEDYKEHIRQIKEAIPFAISSSTDFHEVKGRKVRGRFYSWGIVETENPEHSDFVKFRSMLVTYMQDLRELTHDVHYENYRAQRLIARNTSNSDLSLKDNISIASEDRDRALQEKEAELKRMQEMIDRMQKEIAAKQMVSQPTVDEAIKANGSNGTETNL